MADHPNVALIRAAYEHFTEGGYVEQAAALFSEDVVWRLPGRGPLAGDHRGIEAVVGAIREFERRAAGTLRVEVYDILANDTHAVALLRAIGNRAGKRYEALEIDVSHVRDGKITEFWSFSEDQDATDEFWS